MHSTTLCGSPNHYSDTLSNNIEQIYIESIVGRISQNNIDIDQVLGLLVPISPYKTDCYYQLTVFALVVIVAVVAVVVVVAVVIVAVVVVVVGR